MNKWLECMLEESARVAENFKNLFSEEDQGCPFCKAAEALLIFRKKQFKKPFPFFRAATGYYGPSLSQYGLQPYLCKVCYWKNGWNWCEFEGRKQWRRYRDYFEEEANEQVA